MEAPSKREKASGLGFPAMLRRSLLSKKEIVSQARMDDGHRGSNPKEALKRQSAAATLESVNTNSSDTLIQSKKPSGFRKLLK